MSKGTFSIFVGREGDISYLHKEDLNLDAFGPKIVTRASEVEFDGVSQEWFAVLNDGKEIARHKSRDVVLQMERDVIEDMKSRGEPIPGCGQDS